MELIIGSATAATLLLLWQLSALVRARVRASTQRRRR